jgi:hypothetical protein
MSKIFWVEIVIMAIVAIMFVALPLVKFNYRKTAVIAGASLLATAAGLYAWLGTVPTETQSTTQDTTATSGTKLGSVASMVDELAERLRDNPDDGKSWLLLAQSYEHLNRIPEALDAYAWAKALGQINEKLDVLSASSTDRDQLAGQVFGQVVLSDDAKEIVLPTDTVFIFAKAEAGPPMPLAVLQRLASDLPIDFLLNDSQAMAVGAKLSDYDNVVVTARISRSGIVTEVLKNLEAESGVIAVTDNKHLSLIIE